MKNGKKLMSLFLIPTLCLGLLTPVTSMGTVEAAGEVQSYNGHYYMFVNEIVEVGTAGLQADLMGGHLVTLTSAQEEEFVKKNVSGDTDIWLGATKQNGKWSWCTGEAFSYTNWHEGEPSNGSNENYLELWEGYWDDCDYDKNIGSGCAYVIEWDSKSAYDAYIQGNTTEMRKNITGTKTYNGHTYKYYSNKSTWKEAASYCKKLGGYLVTPTDKKENNFVYKLCGKSNTWIGMNDAKKKENMSGLQGNALITADLPLRSTITGQEQVKTISDFTEAVPGTIIPMRVPVKENWDLSVSGILPIPPSLPQLRLLLP